MKLVITQGDCNGVGIEVMYKGILEFDRSYKDATDCEFSVACNPQTLEEYSQKMGLNMPIINDEILIGDRFCKIERCSNYSPVDFGIITGSAGKLAIESINTALECVIESKADAMVTMPINKESVYKSGFKFPGHTEMIAKRCNVKNPIMILCTKTVRVALATIHSSLHEIQYLLNMHDLVRRGTEFYRTLLNDYGIADPKIAVLGLNPHAGEHGSIGTEEEEIIIPAIERIQHRGIKADGPHSADGFFAHGAYKNYDGILAMYHDQGLIPLKILAQGGGVNFTAGIPIVRTSPDHGTAFPIAGKGEASEQSVVEAFELAYEIAKRRNKH